MSFKKVCLVLVFGLFVVACGSSSESSNTAATIPESEMIKKEKLDVIKSTGTLEALLFDEEKLSKLNLSKTRNYPNYAELYGKNFKNYENVPLDVIRAVSSYYGVWQIRVLRGYDKDFLIKQLNGAQERNGINYSYEFLVFSLEGENYSCGDLGFTNPPYDSYPVDNQFETGKGFSTNIGDRYRGQDFTRMCIEASIKDEVADKDIVALYKKQHSNIKTVKSPNHTLISITITR